MTTSPKRTSPPTRKRSLGRFSWLLLFLTAAPALVTLTRVLSSAARQPGKPTRMTPHEFIAKWKKAQLSERSAAQQHFLDLCELLEQEKPAAADPEGSWYTFERGVHKTGGG